MSNEELTKIISRLDHDVHILYNNEILVLPAQGMISNLVPSLIGSLPRGVLSTYNLASTIGNDIVQANAASSIVSLIIYE